MHVNVKKIVRGGFVFVALALCMAGAALAACPKLLMFDGVDIRTQNNAQQAHYWGRTVGVQGFFVNNVMADWQQDVGDSPTSPGWQQAKLFQATYAKYGVTDNFIKTAIWKPHDWSSASQNAAVVSNFAHAAALAKFAGFKGVALDMEPYVPVWGSLGKRSESPGMVQAEGQAIAKAMHQAYPGMTLVLIKDGLYWAGRKQGYHGGYGLSVPFLRGLLSVPWSQVVIAAENTYDARDVLALTQSTQQRYARFIEQNKLPQQVISVAPGLWPLGKSYLDKSSRVSAGVFAQQLRSALASTTDYVWIYGFGSAWQSDGPYAGASVRRSGPVVADFSGYTHALQQAELVCKTDWR